MINEIINGAAPLESEFADAHPRLYFTEKEWAKIKERSKSRAMSLWYDALINQADSVLDRKCPNPDKTAGLDLRGYGCGLVSTAMAFLLTRRKKYYDTAFKTMQIVVQYPQWKSLDFGHIAHGVGVAYDWLYHDIPDTSRRWISKGLHKHCKGAFREYATYSEYHSFSYTCNHLAVVLSGLTAGAGALYGEHPGPASWLRLAQEKVTLMMDALGPDGISPEGISYGQYYGEFFFKTLAMLKILLGINPIKDSEWCRNYPVAMQYQSFPKNYWKPDATFFQFGDSPGSHWCGPDNMLHLCAASFCDGHAQRFASELRQAGVACDSGPFTNLLWRDKFVKESGPARLPAFRHFEDMGLVFMRSGWTGNENVLALRCGPHAGHEVNKRFKHNVGGGHMHPSAGAVQLFAYGGHLINHTGYNFKMTAHENTLLVNGRGQLGENSTWFEDLEFRKGHPVPSILRAESYHAWDYAVADATPAYPDETGLRRFHRHVLFIKPDIWLIVDDIASRNSAKYELSFHTPVIPVAYRDAGFLVSAETACLWILSLSPDDGICVANRHLIKGVGAHGDNFADRLIITNSSLCRQAVFITFMTAFPAKKKQPNVCPEIKRKGDGWEVRIHNGKSVAMVNCYRGAGSKGTLEFSVRISR